MNRHFDWVSRFILAAATFLLLNSYALGSDADRGDAVTAPNGSGEENVRRLEEISILGRVENPGVLFLLPRAEFRLRPLTAGPDGRKEFLLRDARETAGE